MLSGNNDDARKRADWGKRLGLDFTVKRAPGR